MLIKEETEKTFKDIQTVYCSGCSYGIINKIIGEAIDSLETPSKPILVNSKGCSSFVSDYLNIDSIEAPSGLAPSIATGIKNVYPEKLVLTYQGDGDLLSSGLDDLIHTASRGEKITVIMINNLVMGNLGGYITPTSMVGQVTRTTPYGRSIEKHGKQIKISEIIAKLHGSVYVNRVSVDTNERIDQAKKAIKEALLFQHDGKGFTFVEILAMCPTFWYKTPVESKKWLQETLLHQFPIGLIKRTASK